MTTGNKLNFAVIGCGMLARSQHIPNIARSAKAALHTCCDLSDAALDECRQKWGVKHTSKDFKAVIHDPEVEAICLATTQNVRLPVISEAARAGKPVYVEKPLADNMTELLQIQKIIKESGILFCVGHNRRSSPAAIEAHRIFRAHMTHPQSCPWRWEREGSARLKLKEDGVAAMNVRINDDWYSWKKWVFNNKQSSQGPLLFEFTHFYDLCNWFMAAEPAEVVAVETGMMTSAVIIRYKTGEIATIMDSANGTFGYPKELYEVMGNGGMVVLDHMLEIRTAGIADAVPRQVFPMLGDRHPNVGTEGGLYGWLAKKNTACREAVAKGDPLLQFTAEPDKGHARAIDAFVDEIRGTGPRVCGIDDAVLATKIAFAALKSSAEKRIVEV
ncbi:MAG: Gfo/Idh/MocA family oxidoreductase [Kiritimatiellaeota bacterium]|nr:Gfo/Idh/MocA family oxidoreductase [Kiritimatiellota bacterium]